MNQFWNERYATDEYVYGTEPNQFFKNQLKNLHPGKILFPAEGEGRNAVYAATQEWQVTAFDSSTVAKDKAENLARKNNVAINYMIADYENTSFLSESFDCLVLIFAHMPPHKRKEYHQKLASLLKPGGKLILEGFSKKQIENNTGGPGNVEMLFSEDELLSDLHFFSELTVTEKTTTLNEGPFHQGKASLIQAIGIK